MDRSEQNNSYNNNLSDRSNQLPIRTGDNEYESHLYSNRKESSSSSDLDEFKDEKRRRSSSSSEEVLQHRKRNRSGSRDEIERAKAQGIKNRINSLINEKNSNQIFLPGFDGPLISLSLFNELQPNILSTDVIETAYKDYRSKYESKKYHSFYDEHQNDEWFKEKYDPEIYLKWKTERNVQTKKISQQFSDWLKEEMTQIKLELNEEDEFNKTIKIVLYTNNETKDDYEEKERDISKMTSTTEVKEKSIEILNAPYYAFDPDKQTLFIHQLPRNVSRWQVLDIAKKINGFFSLSLSEPIKSQNYYRFCWLSFENEDKCNSAYEILKDYNIATDVKMHPIKSKSSTIKKIRLTPPLFEERLEEDLNYSKKLIEIYDEDKQLKENPIFALTNITKENQLDLQLIYLRKVHGFCYYCLKEFEDERNLATKCDNAHLRNYKQIGSRLNDKAAIDYPAEVEFDKFFTMKIKEFFEKGVIVKEPKHLVGHIYDELTTLRNNYFKKSTIAVSPEIYQCSICDKKFKGANYVHNHILNKHTNNVRDFVDKKFFDSIKSENFYNDQSKLLDKVKVITSMEEYLNTLNAIKKHQGMDNMKNTSSYHGRSSRDKERMKRKHGREYKDLDDPDLNKNQGKQAISFDDL